MASSKTSHAVHSNSNSKVVLGLLALTVCYQALYQGFMIIQLRNDAEQSEAQCSAGSTANSPQCLERRLFEAWKHAEIDQYLGGEETQKDLEKLIEIVPATSLAPVSPPVAKVGSNLIAGESRIHAWGQQEFDRIYNETMTHIISSSSNTSWGKSIETLQESMEQHLSASPRVQAIRAQKRRAEFDRMYNETLAAIRDHSEGDAYRQHIKDIMREFEERKVAMSHIKHDSSEERWLQFDKLYNETMANIQSRNPMTPWAKNLEQELNRLQHMEEATEGRWAKFNRLYNETMAKIKNRSPVSSWAKGLETIQKKLQRRLDESEQRSGKKMKANLEEEIYSFGRELCEAPERRGVPACAQFLERGSRGTMPANIRKQFAELTARSEAWERNFSDSAASYVRDLCADPARSNYPLCLQKAAAGSAAPTVAPPTHGRLRGTGDYLQRLSWSAVVGSVGKNKNRVSFARSDLQRRKWQGKIPSVACITAVPVGITTEESLKSLIQTFRAQTYEGPRQLILVYQTSEPTVGELVRAHADGTFVRAVGAHERGHFPSTTALRYGAFMASDADVIARWDFDEWHHPDRLSMQVRALAAAGRQAAILQRWTVLGLSRGAPGAAAGLSERVLSDEVGMGLGDSLIAEAKWMQQHWMPLMEEEKPILAGVQSASVAQVNMPELIVHMQRPEKDESLTV